MTVYAEFVFLTNVIIDAFLGAMTVIVLRGRISAIRISLFSFIGGSIACVYPLVGNYGYLIKVVGALLLPPILTKIDKFSTYCTTVAVFVALSLGMGGAVLALNVTFGQSLSFKTMTYGTIPFIFALSGLFVLILYAVYKKYNVRIRSKNENLYKVSIKNDNGFCNCRAFYDTGNRVYTNYGERVVIVSSKVYNKLMPAEEEEIIVNTPTGVGTIKAINAEIVIYFQSGNNKIYNVKAGKGRLDGDIPIILHGDMSEEEE